MAFEGGRGALLAPGERMCAELIFGVGVETVAAATSASIFCAWAMSAACARRWDGLRSACFRRRTLRLRE